MRLRYYFHENSCSKGKDGILPISGDCAPRIISIHLHFRITIFFKRK
jgi:hypothetical protein